MNRTKFFWIFLATFAVGSFLFLGCYTQLERPDLEVADDYSQDDAEAYDSYEDATPDSERVVENNYNNYYFDTDSDRRMAYPFYYRPLSRYDALLFFDSYDPWLNYYGWWPFSTSSVYWVYDPWYYRYHYYGPDWWDNYYLPDGNYPYQSNVRQQRPFGQRHFSNLDFPSPTVKQRMLMTSLEEPRARMRTSHAQGTNTISKERGVVSNSPRRSIKTAASPARLRSLPASDARQTTARTKRSSTGNNESVEKKKTTERRTSVSTIRNNDSNSKRSNRSTPAPAYSPARSSTKSSNSGSSSGSNSGSGSKSSSGSGSKSSSGSDSKSSSSSSGSSSSSKSSSKRH